MENLSEKELKRLLKMKKKKRMKTSKKVLLIAFTICILLIIFTMGMIVLGRDTHSLSILATAGVGILPIMYGIYQAGSTKENLKHMEKDYNPNYDEERGIY